MAKTYERLIGEIEKLKKQASKIGKQRAKAISTVKKLIRKHTLTAADIGLKGAARLARRVARRTKRIAPKYRGPAGETWTGRGLMPRWLKDTIKKGKKREDFLIKKLAGK
jgi:DNA-binding protein H-NS